MTYKNDKKDGLRRLWSNNDLLEEGLYVMGKENGLHRKTWRHSTYDHFTPDRYILCYYQNGEKHGDYKKFDEIIIEAGKYINDKKEGKWEEWYGYDADGPYGKEWLKKVGNYKNGEKNGAFEEYYVSGENKLSTTYLNDKPNGIHKEWGEDGKLEVVYFYDNGNQDQTKVWWVSNTIGDRSFDKIKKGQALYAEKNNIYLGKIPSEKWKGYDDNLFSGTGYQFNEHDNIIQELYCLNGQIQLHSIYLDNGNLIAEIKYEDGQCIEKVSYMYSEDMMTESKSIIKLMDQMVYEREFWSNDVLLVRWKRNGLSKKWYENGQIEEEGQYIDGKRDGLHREWYENGNIKSERNWNSDIPIGTFITYLINGKKESEAIYEDGKLNGKFKRWHENGVVAEEIKYKKGEIIKKKCRSIENKKINCSE
jgi:antitoxin component YwqK of YwqJK toxin-antitoxin module